MEMPYRGNMQKGYIIALGIAFIAAGAFFCLIALYLSRPESVKKAAISKPSSIIFYIIGALTLVMGLLALIFLSSLTKSAVQIGSLLYLVLLTVLFAIFTFMLKGKK